MSLVSRSYSEKRNFLRMQVDAPVSITLPDRSEVLLGTCKDLSGGGLLVEVPDHLQEGTDATVEISSSHGHNPILQAKAKVTRVKQLATKGYLVGFEISEVVDHN